MGPPFSRGLTFLMKDHRGDLKGTLFLGGEYVRRLIQPEWTRGSSYVLPEREYEGVKASGSKRVLRPKGFALPGEW